MKPQDFGNVTLETDNDVTDITEHLNGYRHNGGKTKQQRKVENKRKWSSTSPGPNVTRDDPVRRVALGNGSLMKITANFVEKRKDVIVAPKRKIQLTRLKPQLCEDAVKPVETNSSAQSEITTSPTEELERRCKSSIPTAADQKEEKSVIAVALSNRQDIGQQLVNGDTNNNNKTIIETTDYQSPPDEPRPINGDGRSDGGLQHGGGVGHLKDPIIERDSTEGNASGDVKQDIVITNIVHLNAYYRCLSSLSRTTRYKKRYDTTIHSIRKKSQSIRTQSPYWSWLRHAVKDAKPDKQLGSQLIDFIQDSVNVYHVSRQGGISLTPPPRGQPPTACKTKEVAKRVCYDLRDNTELMTVDEILDAERSCKRKVPSRVRKHQ